MPVLRLRPSTRRRVLAALALAAATLAGCGAAPPPTPAAAANPKTAPGTLTRFAGDPRVLVYASNDWGFTTNTFFIEGPGGLVALDTQFLPSAAEEAITRAESLTGKRVVAAVVLHANPDKFNGTATFQRHGARVVTSASVAELLPAVHAQRKGKFWSTYAPDYPADPPTPEVFDGADAAFEAAGVSLRLRAVGPGCSKAHVLASWEGHVFGGDLVANGHHAWLELGLVDAWAARLDEMAAGRPKFVHPGRGPSGGPELLTAQRAYLDEVVALVRAEPALPLPMPDETLARLKGVLQARHPGWDNAHFLRFGLPAVWRREAARR